MGLVIDSFCYSYSTLHRLRDAAFKVEGNKLHACGNKSDPNYYENAKYSSFEEMCKLTRFPMFIFHSDAYGGYIIDATEKQIEYGWYDLDRLKEEVYELDNHIRKYLDPDDFQAWEHFFSDVMEEDVILRFC